jgi:pyruvate/2-oxoglutarate dehydrogenase complex dihydrolipoamide acyltransferase (E2) component
MRVSVKLVRVGMNMEEATVTKWHKQPGELFRTGDILYEIETEKVTQEVEATGDGVLLEVSVPAGEIAKVGEQICVVDLGPVKSKPRE